jgi:hypothetical protein
VVYGTRFEIGRGVILTEGSNPSLSAITPIPLVGIGVMAFKGGLRPPCRRQRGLTAEFCETQNQSIIREAHSAGTTADMSAVVNPSLSAEAKNGFRRFRKVSPRPTIANS